MSSTRALEKALADAREGKLASALASVRMIAQRDPKNLEAMFVLASLLADSGQLTQAIHHYSRWFAVAEPDPSMRVNLPPVRNNYANALMAVGRRDEALMQWREALRISPDYDLPYIGLVRGLIECGDAEGAVREGMQGLARKPGSPLLVELVSEALEAAMRLDEAVDLLRNTLDADPSQPHLRSRLLTALNYVDCPLA